MKYLLRAVVTIVVDIDSCCNPTNDKGHSTTYQVKPLRIKIEKKLHIYMHIKFIKQAHST